MQTEQLLLSREIQVVHLMKDRVNFVKELWDLCAFFFIAPASYDEKTVKKRWKEYSAQQITELSDVLQDMQIAVSIRGFFHHIN